MKSILFFSLLTILYSGHALSEEGDGVIFDENGLTLMYRQAPLVDKNRWNSSDGIYSRINVSPNANMREKAMIVKAIKDEKGKIVAVKKGLGNNFEMHANGVFIQNNLVVTTKFCKDIEDKKFSLQADKCKDAVKDLFDTYENQATDKTLKTIQETTKLDGDGLPQNLTMFLFRKNLVEQSAALQNSEKQVQTKTIFGTLGILTKRCEELKRYSEDEASATPAAAPATPQDSASK